MIIVSLHPKWRLKLWAESSEKCTISQATYSVRSDLNPKNSTLYPAQSLAVLVLLKSQIWPMGTLGSSLVHWYLDKAGSDDVASPKSVAQCWLHCPKSDMTEHTQGQVEHCSTAPEGRTFFVTRCVVQDVMGHPWHHQCFHSSPSNLADEFPSTFEQRKIYGHFSSY